MIAFLGIMRNNWYRLREEKARMLLMQAMIVAVIVIAILMNGRPITAAHIALVVQADTQILQSPYLTVTQVQEMPPLSALVANQYDAIVTHQADAFEIATIKSDAFRNTLQSVLDDPFGQHAQHLQGRGKGTNILGYLVMFLLMQGNFLQFMFSEDKERGQLRRIASAPISIGNYLLANSLFAFLALYVPTILLLYAVRFVMGAQIGFTLWQYAGLLAMLCAFAITFPLMMQGLLRSGEQANMYGSALIVLTSILSGGFSALDNGNTALQMVTHVLPQKAMLTIAESLESGGGLHGAQKQLLFVRILTLAMFIFGVVKCKRDVMRRN